MLRVTILKNMTIGQNRILLLAFSSTLLRENRFVSIGKKTSHQQVGANVPKPLWEAIKGVRSGEGQLAEYEQLVNTFYENLKSKRKMTKMTQEQNRRESLKKLLNKFPGWDEMTISNLHNLFLLFDDNKNAMLNLEDFCALLESLGNNSSYDVRTDKFNEADSNKDGWITFDEFLPAIYNFDPPSRGVLKGLGKQCVEASENIRFVSGLTVGEQLEYGLF